MEIKESDRKLIEKIVDNLKKSVEEQRARVGYYFFGGVNNGL